MINRFFILFLTYISISFYPILAKEKTRLIDKLIKIETLTFSFDQITNGKGESGICDLAFPGKLKCIYNSKEGKELIINGNSLAIIQKKYDKIYYYPISKSPLNKILDKEELIKIIKNNNLNYLERKLFFLINTDNKQELIIFFNKNNFDLLGWETTDKFKNKITFNIKVISINKQMPLKEFNIPKKN